MSLNNIHELSVMNEENDDKKGNKKKKIKKTKLPDEKGDVDTSNFTIEERLVSAVWVHERKLDRTSIAQIKINFRMRFGKPPPTKNTLYFWEKKLFSTGKVMDAKRSGRPCRRKAHIPSVEASLQQSPGLSLRARAEQLSLPRTTLKKILREDLQIRFPDGNTTGTTNKIENENPLLTPRINKQSMIKNNPDPSTSNVPCANLAPPPSYSYPEPLSSLPLSAFQHFLTYPNNSHHQPQIMPAHSKLPDGQNHSSSIVVGSHMISHPHQQHNHPGNHHNYVTNGQVVLDKNHLGYGHNGDHHNTVRNQMPQGFHS